MKRLRVKHSTACALLAVAAIASIGVQHLSAQEAAATLHGYYASAPWTGGTIEDALAQSQQGGTIPMTSYSLTATKDGNAYSGVVAGGNPTVAATTKISTVVVPIKFIIVGTTFDPNALNPCDGNVSAKTRFAKSPLIAKAPFTINGVAVGTDQYTDAFIRAEFWSFDSHKFHDNLSPVKYAKEITITADATVGTTFSSGCGLLGILSNGPLSSYLSGTVIPGLQSSGVVNPSQFLIFLVKNVVQSTATPPNVAACCILGFHSAQGSPAQTWTITDYDVSGDFGAAVSDVSVSSHEINEWMNDPLVNNPTPAWGGIGQVGGCQGNFEVGDPLSGTLMPPVVLNGYTYHLQELAFFSWFYNADGVASSGTGGKFSSNGTFNGPSKPCPPGGTWPN